MSMKTTTPTDASPSKRRRFFTWRTLRRIMITLAWATTIAALFYGVENWRGNHAWERSRADAEAHGAHLDWRKYYVPPPIPDDQNFVMAGNLPQTLFNPDQDKIVVSRDLFFKAGKPQVPKPAWTSFHFTDLAAWEKAMTAATRPGAPAYGVAFDVSPDPDPASRAAAAPGILRMMQDVDPTIEELRAASVRPLARYPFHYDAETPASIGLPYYSTLKVFGERLRLRACAELALGRNDDAAADFKLMSYLADSMRNDNFTAAVMVRITMLTSERQVIWEGLAEHRWSDAQLAEIQKTMLAQNYVAEMQRDLESERAAMIEIIEYMRTKADLKTLKLLIGFGYDEGSASSNWDCKAGVYLLWSMPKGWSQLEKVNYVAAFEERFGNVFDPAARRVFPGIMESNIRNEPAAPRSNSQAILQHRFVQWVGLGVLDQGIVSKAASAQCQCDEAAIACALERYRLAKGAYPAELDALAPEFIPALPHEVTTGEGYRYRLDGDRYTLYSVGWDLKDHGGKPGAKQYGMDGDWVWR